MSEQASKIEYIDSSLIIEAESSIRALKRDSESYLGLVASIREKGFLGTLTVRPVAGPIVDGVATLKYEILDGLHRFNACRDVGINPIACVVKQMEKSDVLEWQMMANHHKIETRPVEYTQQLQRMIALNPALTMNEIAARLGVSTGFIDGRLGLLKLSDGIQTLVDDGKITLSNAQVLCKLPEEEQSNFVEFAITQNPKEFAQTVNNRRKQLNEARKLGKEAGPPVFTPTRILRKKDEIETELDRPSRILKLIDAAGVTTISDAVKVALSYCLSVDTDSLAAKQAEWNAREAEKKANETKRKADREAKRRAEAQEVLATSNA